MKKSIVSFLSLIYMMPVIARAESQSCEIRGMQNSFAKCYFKGCPTIDRTRSLTFPDGREFTIIGHNHGDRAWISEITQLILAEPFSKKALSQRLDQLETEDPTFFNNSKADVDFLKQYLSDKREKTFVGVETVNSFLEGHTEVLDMTQARLSANPHRLSPKLLNRSQSALLAAYGPPIYLRSTANDLFKNSELKGFESDETIKREQKIDEIRGKRYETLELLAQNNPEDLEHLMVFQDEFIKLNETYDPEKNEKEILEKWRHNSSFMPHKKKLVYDWARAEVNSLNARYERDRITAKGMLSDGRSGVLFVGQLHLNTIARLLQKECVELKTKSSASTDIATPSTAQGKNAEPATAR